MDEHGIVDTRTLTERSSLLMKRFALDPTKGIFICNGFSEQCSLEEMFTFMWDAEEAHEILTPSPFLLGKSEFNATQLREKGNKYFREKCLYKAIEFYNLSIMSAPHPEYDPVEVPSVELVDKEDVCEYTYVDPRQYGGTQKMGDTSLAIGFANRSAVLFELKFYEKCLRDINLALKYGYPKHLHAKLEERKQKCLTAQACPSDINKLSDDGVSESEEARVSKITEDGGLSYLKERLSYVAKEAPKIIDPNKTVPAISSSLKITYTPSKGRGLVAVRNISPGEVLGVESAFCAVLDFRKLHYYCGYCFQSCYTPLPCPSCIDVIFCSDLCRTKALSGDHWLECKILPSMACMGQNINDMAYKVLKGFTYSQMSSIMKQLRREKRKQPEDLGRNKRGIYSSTSYKPFYHISYHRETITNTELILYCELSFIYTKLLDQSKRYFVDDHGEPFIPTRKDYLATGQLLLSHLMKINRNKFSIGDEKNTGKSGGSALFPTLSLANHSCDPSATYYEVDRKLVFRALRPIKEGEEVFISYTQPCRDLEQTERKKELMKYNFTCHCEACEQHWPIYLAMPSKAFRCLKCKVALTAEYTCPKCKLRHNDENYRGNKKLSVLEWRTINMKIESDVVLKAFAIGRQLKATNVVSKEDYEYLCQATGLSHKYMAMPSRCLCDLERTLIRCFYVGL